MEWFSIIIPLGLFVFACWGLYYKITSDKKAKNALKNDIDLANEQTKFAIDKNISQMRDNYYRIKKQILIPDNCPKIDVETTVFGLPCKAQATAGQLNYLQNDFYCWVDNDVLFIFPTEDHFSEKHITYRTLPKDLERVLDNSDIKLYQIKKDDIDYYRIIGEKRAEMRVQTANTEVNVKGAIVGGLIAGEAGAIIGSQHNRNNVYSTTQHFDERYVELIYRKSGLIKKLKLSIPAYSLFEEWFPDKEYDFVVSNTGTKNDDSFEIIKKYKKLLDEGIITQEEFDKKKKEVLSL